MASKLPSNIPQDERFLYKILKHNFYHNNWKTAPTLQKAGVMMMLFTIAILELHIIG